MKRRVLNLAILKGLQSIHCVVAGSTNETTAETMHLYIDVVVNVFTKS